MKQEMANSLSTQRVQSGSRNFGSCLVSGFGGSTVLITVLFSVHVSLVAAVVIEYGDCAGGYN